MRAGLAGGELGMGHMAVCGAGRAMRMPPAEANARLPMREAAVADAKKRLSKYHNTMNQEDRYF